MKDWTNLQEAYPFKEGIIRVKLQLLSKHGQKLQFDIDIYSNKTFSRYSSLIFHLNPNKFSSN